MGWHFALKFAAGFLGGNGVRVISKVKNWRGLGIVYGLTNLPLILDRQNYAA
jgi:hypothetical protein